MRCNILLRLPNLLKNLRDFFEKIRVLYRLGLLSIIAVLLHRIKCRVGYYQWRQIQKNWTYSGALFSTSQIKALSDIPLSYSERYLRGEHIYFFHDWLGIKQPNQWIYNPWTQHTLPESQQHWSKIKLFSEPGEDIKVIWELSRFYWAPQLAYQYLYTKDIKYLDCLNNMISDWMGHNPPNRGYQWICAQETSIRLMNVILSDQILKNLKKSDALIEFVYQHVNRILPTLSYAVAQKNNHATSEAAGLLIGGLWLSQYTQDESLKAFGEKLYIQSRGLLEKNIDMLILEDGVFSQYSLNYQRFFLQVISLCLFFQKENKRQNFSKKFLQKYEKAFLFLYTVTDPISGLVPNMGANDGGLLFKLDQCDFGDYRPVLQFTSYLLYGAPCFLSGQYDQACQILGVSTQNLPVVKIDSKPQDFSEGGFFKFQNAHYWGLVRYPKFKFRPSQCDLFHFDLWVKGKNILIDSGTYSYNPISKADQLKWTNNHNTVQVDGVEQMPSYGRFLLGAWPKAKVVRQDNSWEAEFKTVFGYSHRRKLIFEDCKIIVLDALFNVRKRAQLFWHLGEGNWQVNGNSLMGEQIVLQVKSTGKSFVSELISGYHSLYYHHRDQHQVYVGSAEPDKNSEVQFETVIMIKEEA